MDKKELKINFLVRFTFFSVGMCFWALAGFVIITGTLEPTIPLETIQNNKELAIMVSRNWGSIINKFIALWSIIGGIFGLLICQLYVWRPTYEHYTNMPNVSGSPTFAPRTLAETHTGFQSWVLGIIIGICGAIYIIPMFQNEILVIKSLKMRCIISGIASLISTVWILPFSLNLIVRKINRRQY